MRKTRPQMSSNPRSRSYSSS